MAVAIDVAGTEVLGGLASSSPQTYTGLTTGGSLSNGCVTFVVMYDNLAVTGTAATWDGVACTLIASQNSTGGTFGRVELWGLSPIGTHTGNKTFSITFTGGTAQLVIQGLSWTGANQTGGTTTFNHSVAATANTNTATGDVISQTGDAVFAGYVCANQTMSALTGVTLFNDNTPNSYIAAASRTSGAALVTMSATLSGISIWAMAGANIQQPSTASTAGATAMDAGTTFRRPFLYRSLTQPVNFTATPPPYAGWDDVLEWPRPAPPRSPIYFAPFLAQSLGLFQAADNPADWTNWPDFLFRARRVPDLFPWSFNGNPIVPFADPTNWPDIVPRRCATIDTPPAFVAVVIAAQAQVWYPADRWPDWFPAKRIAVDPISETYVALVPSANVIGDWPDFVRRKPQPIDTQPLSWTGQTIFAPAPTMAWVRWPDFAPKKPVPLNYDPLTLTQLAPQVWFPYGPWDDFTRRKPVAQDTQRFAWNPFTPPPGFFLVPDRWPDLIYKKPVPLNYVPLTFLQTVTSPYNSFVNWPDFATKKRPPLNYEPLTYLQLVRTPWNEMSRWPDFVPIRSKAGLLAALQQFQARFPGVITQATITGIISAFETNADVAAIAIFVGQTRAATSAAVSIQEIGTI